MSSLKTLGYDEPTAQYYLGAYNLILLIILTIIAIGTYLKWFPATETYQMLTYTACAGGMGGSIYNMRIVAASAAHSSYQWDLWFFLFPITSIFFGVISFMLIAGGLLVLSGAPGTTAPYIFSTMAFYIGVAFLAGFSTDQFIKKMTQIAGVIFSETEALPQKSPVIPVPTITDISPTSGTTAGGDTVTITGTGLDGIADVFFGTSNSSPHITLNSDTTITAISPPGTGAVDVIVTKPSGTSKPSAKSQFTYK